MRSKEEDERRKEVAEVSHIQKYAGKFKLLSKVEERDLISTFQFCARMNSLLIQSTKFSSTNKKRAPIAPAAFVMLTMVKRAVTNKLVSCNLRLVVQYAFRYMDRGIPLTDLIQEGVDGFIHAVELFDLNTGNRLSTYAVQWIRQRMGRAIENKSKVVKTPSTIIAEQTKLKKIYRRWVEKHGEPPTAEEISAQWPIAYPGKFKSPEECEELGRYDYEHSSLDETVGEDDNISLVAYLACDDKVQPENQIEKSEDKSYVRECLFMLEPEDSEFISLRFGFLDEKERSDKEMASLYQTTIKEIKDRERGILAKLEVILDRTKVNSSYLCDVLLTRAACGENRLKTIEKVRELNPGISWMGAVRLVEEAPARVAYKLPQDKATDVIEEFLALGTQALIVRHVA